jgi:threonine dehydratase
MFSLPELEDAAKLNHAAFAPTPQIAWRLLAQRTGAEVWVKHENHTPIGAFKLRGGLVYVERLKRERPQIACIVSATRGNHGQSLAWAGRRYGVPVTIVVPHGNSAEKNAAMLALGAQLIEHGEDFEAAKAEAARLAQARGLEFAPAFATDLVKGVATYSLELMRAVANLDALYVPIGLGSGICGAIRTRDLLGLSTEIVGVQASGADCYAQSLKAGKVVVLNRAQTLADGVAVRQPDPEAFRQIRAGASRIVTVSDDEIAAAIRAYWTDTHNLVEGAGAAPLAALLQERERMRGKRVALVVSGGNIDLDLFRTWVLPGCG